MSSFHPHAAAVKAERSPFRPVQTCPEVSWADFDNRREFTIHRGKVRETYCVTPLSTDLVGVALRLSKVGGKSYDLFLGVAEAHCSCPGHCWTSGCKHLRAVQMLVEAGVIQPAADIIATA